MSGSYSLQSLNDSPRDLQKGKNPRLLESTPKSKLFSLRSVSQECTKVPYNGQIKNKLTKLEVREKTWF